MSSEYSYFTSIMKDEKLLREHGFDAWPNEEELSRYLMDTNDRMTALEQALGLTTTQDIRGRWQVQRSREAV